jgi:hypothetical protein
MADGSQREGAARVEANGTQPFRWRRGMNARPEARFQSGAAGSLSGVESVFKRNRDDSERWDVFVDGACIGTLRRRGQIGLNRTKSYLYSGSGRHVALWEGTVEGVALGEDEREAVERHVTRGKTTRQTAAQHLVDAYQRAGVPLPQAERRRAA